MSARIRAGSGFKRFLCSVLIDASAEKPCSLKYVDGPDYSVFIMKEYIYILFYVPPKMSRTPG
jgi:hypothetical protein